MVSAPSAIEPQIPTGEGFVFSPEESCRVIGSSNSLNVALAFFNRKRVPDNSPFDAAKWIPRQRRRSTLEYSEHPILFEPDQRIRARMTLPGTFDDSTTKSIRRYIFGSSPFDPVWTFHWLKRVNSSSGRFIDCWQIEHWLVDIFSKRLKGLISPSNNVVSFDVSEQDASAVPPIVRKQQATLRTASLFDASFLFSNISSTERNIGTKSVRKMPIKGKSIRNYQKLTKIKS